ncbi:hypothetical protein M514_13992, partial [Trichuris suis]
MEDTTQQSPQHDPERTAGGDGAEVVAAAYPGPFRCPLCATAVSVGHSFIEHMRTHGREVTFLCGKCSRSCPTIHSVACHYSKCGRQVTRRESRLPPIAVEERARSVVCPECGARFTIATGLQLHRRSVHVDEFNADRPREKKMRWSRLAALEAELSNNVANVNQILSKRMFEKHGLTRNVEMIRGQRRRERYKALVLSLRPPAGDSSDTLSERSAFPPHGSVLSEESAFAIPVNVLPDTIVPPDFVLAEKSAFPSPQVLSAPSAFRTPVNVLSAEPHILPNTSAFPMSNEVLPAKEYVLPEQLNEVLPDVLPEQSAFPSSTEVRAEHPAGFNGREISYVAHEVQALPICSSHNEQPEWPCTDLVEYLREVSGCDAPAGTLQQALPTLAASALKGEYVLNDTAEAVLKFISPPRQERTVPSKSATSFMPSTVRQQKRVRFRQLKKLFNTNKKRLAEAVPDGAPPVEHEVPLKDCVEFYTEAFGNCSAADNASYRQKELRSSMRVPTNLLVLPILPNDIKAALSKIPRRSAGGPDKITVDHVRGLKEAELLLLLNLWLFYQDVPAYFKVCRTVLIPKKSQ